MINKENNIIKLIAQISNRNTEFRNKLTEITDSDRNTPQENWREILSEKKEAVLNLSKDFGCSLILVEEIKYPQESKEQLTWLEVYDCFMYILNLHKDPSRKKIDEIRIKINERYNRQDGLVDGKCMEFLISKGYLIEVPLEKIQDDDIILYFDGSEPKHAGKIKNGKIISKWGPQHLWEHDIWDVPIHYGKQIKFYKNIPEEKTIIYYKEYIETKAKDIDITKLFEDC